MSETFGKDVDYAQVTKIFQTSPNIDKETGYIDQAIIDMQKRRVIGKPKKRRATTNHVERQNLTMRMSMRGYTRSTNAFSKRFENHFYQIDLYFVYYNFCWIHESLGITPALEAGLTNTV